MKIRKGKRPYVELLNRAKIIIKAARGQRGTTRKTDWPKGGQKEVN